MVPARHAPAITLRSCARRCIVAALWLGLAMQAVAQDRGEPAAGRAVGPSIQVDLTGVLRSVVGALREAPLTTDWPDANTTNAMFSLAAELVRRPVADVDAPCEPGQLLVWWPDRPSAEDGQLKLRELQGIDPALRAELPVLGGVLAMYALPDNDAALALRSRLRSLYPGWIVDLNARSAAAAGPRLYALQQLQAPGALAATQPQGPATGGTAGVRIGVIDGPITSRDDLAVGSFRGISVLRPEDEPASPTHGNAVSRLIAGRRLANGFSGAAPPGIGLHWATVTRMVQGHERSNTWGQVLALDWLLGEEVHLVNVSMGGPGDAVLAAAYRKATGRPMLLLAAAGNSGPGAAPVFPAAYPGVLAVTATDALMQVYAWANQGPHVALAAPGVELWVPGSSTGEAPSAEGHYVSGTSFASALATSMLARWGETRLRQAHAERLAPVCKAARDLGLPGRDPVFGCGLVR